MTVIPQAPFTVVHGAGPLPGALSRAVVAIGNFDGVHLGHRAVIAAARARAHTLGVPAAVLTFEPHPRSFFQPQTPLFRLTDERAKLRLLAATGLAGAIVLEFDAALAEPEPEDFVNDILLHRLGISGAAVGFDFRFGHNRTGTPELLAAEGTRRKFTVDVVPAVEIDGARISSGRIREALAAGHVGQADAYLGYPWFITGEVVHGDKRGRELGYPTANMRRLARGVPVRFLRRPLWTHDRRRLHRLDQAGARLRGCRRAGAPHGRGFPAGPRRAYPRQGRLPVGRTAAGERNSLTTFSAKAGPPPTTPWCQAGA